MAATPQRESLGAVDTAWLRMDRPTNLMMICGVLLLDAPLSLARLRALVRERMLCFHRFRQRVADAGGSPYWETDAAFDLDWHVRHIALPRGATLEEMMGDLASTALDPAKPMWQFHLVEMAGAAALIMRIHHCYGDGFAMLHLLEALTDADPLRPRAGGGDLVPPPAALSAWERVLGAGDAGLAGSAWRALRAAAGAGAGLLADHAAALEAACAGASLLNQAAVIAAMQPDAPSRLKGELGVVKKVACAAPLPLPDVKAVAHVLGCSVNDVLLACLAGALRAYLARQGDAVEGLAVRVLVPVNLRPAGRLATLGNQFGLVFLDLPVDIEAPVQRAVAVHRRMAELRQSKQALVALGILAAMGCSPGFLRERLIEALAANASAVVTNVHGPDTPRYLAGVRIARQLFWVPQSGGIALGVSLLSYAGQVSLGVAADARRVPDPAAIAALFGAQFEELLLSALMLPWPGEPGAAAAAGPLRAQ